MADNRSKPPKTARGGALALLEGVLDQGQPLSELTEPVLAPLPPADRARAQRLATETLRHIGRIDRLLKPGLRRLPPPRVRNILRLAVLELAEGGAPHGVVSAAVSATKAGPGGPGLARMANAVLRRTADDLAEAWNKEAPTSLPNWLKGRVDSAYGRKVRDAIEYAHSITPPLDLTPKVARAEDLAALVGGTAMPTGSVRLDRAGQVSVLPGFETGDWWVQDAAAVLPARLLAPEPGERILDLCAAPGGKTLQLAAAGAQVTALDISGPRMRRLTENLDRTGLTADLVIADAFEWVPTQPFDAILLDAPCTATGTIRRHPDLPLVRDGSEIKPLVELQARLIDRALTWLRPGGRLVFSTCSLLPAEGEDQIRAALVRNQGLVLDLPATPLPGTEADWVGPHGLRLRPDYWSEAGGMDGFFLSRLKSS